MLSSMPIYDLRMLDKVIHVIHVYAGWYAQIYKTLTALLQ